MHQTPIGADACARRDDRQRVDPEHPRGQPTFSGSPIPVNGGSESGADQQTGRGVARQNRLWRKADSHGPPVGDPVCRWYVAWLRPVLTDRMVAVRTTCNPIVDWSNV